MYERRTQEWRGEVNSGLYITLAAARQNKMTTNHSAAATNLGGAVRVATTKSA